MVDKISRIYGSGSLQPTPQPPKSKKSEKTESSAPARRPNPAARLVPDLKDRVEISEEGRAAARAMGASEDVKLPEGTTEAVSSSWYSTGYAYALDTVRGKA
jgi:hypothetical protein